MTDHDGEPEFQRHATDAAESIRDAIEELTEVRAYVLSEGEMEDFKRAQMGLRELHHNFEQYLSDDESVEEGP